MKRLNKYSMPMLLLALAAFFMTFCTMASPLYTIHNGVDQNCFMTVGRAMLDGKVLYRDIFEQKGPLLYAIHAFASLIDSKGFVGIYILEILNFWGYMLILKKIAEMFCSERRSTGAAVLAGLLTVTAFCFSRGDNAEEFCLPLLAFPLLALLRYTLGKEERMSRRNLFLSGLCAGGILWIKYTMLGLHIAWFFCVLFVTLKRRNLKAAIADLSVFVGGVLLTAFVWFIYFAANGALADWWNVYFYSNIFLYSGKLTVLQRIAAIITKDLRQNPFLVCSIVAGVLSIAFGSRYSLNKESRVALLSCSLSLYFFLFAGGTRYLYYYLAMAVFSIFGAIALLTNYRALLPKSRPILAMLTSAACLVATVSSNCIYFVGKGEINYPQYQFAEIMGESPKVLNYRFLDGGFYLASNADLPETKYFCTVNISKANLPDMYEQQDELIRSGEIDYVITRFRLDGKNEGKERPCTDLFLGYREIAVSVDVHDGYGYRLFRHK